MRSRRALGWRRARVRRRRLPPTEAAPVRITQFYATSPQLARGEKELLCYGVENAKTVWLSPPRRELSAALSRCVDVDPAETTTYTLTAEGAGGSGQAGVTVTLGAAKAKIIEVRVSSLDVKARQPGEHLLQSGERQVGADRAAHLAVGQVAELRYR